MADVARQMGFGRSTVNTIVKDKARILEFASTSSSTDATIISKKRDSMIERMEHLLRLWIDEMSRNGSRAVESKIPQTKRKQKTSPPSLPKNLSPSKNSKEDSIFWSNSWNAARLKILIPNDSRECPAP